MSEMYPEKPLIPDESLALLHAELEAALATGGQEAVEDIWTGIERFTHSQNTPEIDNPVLSERRFPEDYSEQELLDAAAYTDRALKTMNTGLARLFLQLGPPPQHLRGQKQREEE